MNAQLDIIIVDDNPELCEILERRLQNASHRTRIANDTKIAINLVRERCPDLVITDIAMPDREGADMIAELGRSYPDLRFIGISGGGASGDCDLLELAESLGADAVLRKPFTTRQLFDTIAHLDFAASADRTVE